MDSALTDVTPLNRLLERAKRTWQATFDAIVDPIAIVDREYRIVRTNRAHATIAGRDIKSVNGRACHDVLFGRSDVCVGCPLMRALTTQKTADGEIEQVETATAGARTYRMWAFPMAGLLHDPWGEALEGRDGLAVCHYKDVTEERALERQLVQKEKMAAIGTLAGGVAHEINNPLGAILAFSQLAALDLPPDGPLREYLHDIEQAALRCKRIVSGLLDFSRQSSGQRRLASARDIVDGSLFLCKQNVGRRPIAVATAHEDGADVHCDINQLQQVVVNLVSNAIAAVRDVPDREPLVSVRTVNDGDVVRIIVEDNGAGIRPVDLPKIFDPFFTTKPEGQGTGLGLSVSYGIVKHHGGTITVSSEAGTGSRFIITLPRAESGAVS